MDEPTPETSNGEAPAAPDSCDVVIVGAGPYGLAAAAHLRALDGLDVRIFGDPMSFWRSMPRGMMLRSRWEASHIAYPSGELSLDAYQAETGESFGAPIPLEHFVEYGKWVQRHIAPDVDGRRIMSVERDGEGFLVTIDDGTRLKARRVVVAAGIESFANRPAEFDGLPEHSVTHSSEHSDFARFAGRNVIVIGGGQSALESGALLHESGAQVEVIARRPTLTWLKGGVIQRKLGPFKPVFYAPTDVGPIGMSRLLAVPDAFRHLPRSAQDKMARRAIRPAGAKWLQTRLVDVPITTGRTVVNARNGNGVELELDDATTRNAEHVVLGTGYRIDLRNYGFLSDELVSEIRSTGGYPVLGRGLESSVPGLHFMGAPAAWSFGPLMRFVSGTWWSGRALARSVSP
ncbi:MAG TPA: FAD-dependent oxidoreductase [Gaiellaceae bacterium]|nr:FAD-dependent oxidoreductase [Gaiellaceae bacterium]